MGAEEIGETPQANDKPTQIAISQDQFLAWKRQKDAELSAKQAEAARKREQDIASGRVQMNGRELFLHEPWVLTTLTIDDSTHTTSFIGDSDMIKDTSWMIYYPTLFLFSSCTFVFIF